MPAIRHLPIANDSERRTSSSGVSRLGAGQWPLVRQTRKSTPDATPDATPETTSDAVVESDHDGHSLSEQLLQVGDLARASGKTVRAIHHYEEVGLLKPHARSKGRYRLYDQAAVTRVRWIGKLHDLGLSLSQIQEVVTAWESAPSAPEAMARMRSMYLQKLQETRAQITNLMSLERELLASIDYLDTCDTCDPDELVAACTSCHVRERTREEPDLVAGIYGGCGPLPTR